MKFYSVETISVDLSTGRLNPTPSVNIFMSEKAANAFMVEEMKWEGTVSVKCPALGTDVEGEFVNVSHSFNKGVEA